MLIIFFVNFSVSQENNQKNLNKDLSVKKIENYIFSNTKDSISILIKSLPQTDYIQSLKRIYKNENPTYKDYYDFIIKTGNRSDLTFEVVSDFINSRVKTPSDRKKIDLIYVEIKWFQVTKLRDEDTIENASEEQYKLEDYINLFDYQDKDVIRSKVLISTHQVVLLGIEEEIEKGKELCLKNIAFAKKNNDKVLNIIFLYHLCDFLILEGKLDDYIGACEQSLALEKQLFNNTSYYIGTICHLIDAYIYKGNHELRVLEFLDLLFTNEDTRKYSYSFFVKFIGTPESTLEIEKNIYNKFNVSGLIPFCKKLENIAEGKLNANDYYYLIFEISKTLEIKGYLKEALAYKQKCVFLTREIYSKDLSSSLASYKLKQAVKQKNIEIKLEKEQKKLYLIISLLVMGLLIVSVFLIFKIKKQSRVLKNKNILISKTLKEKELLVREVHHRVKNNFQIVSSLLELQTKGIEDKKALALANEGKNRVKAMALIHQKLYQNNDGLVDFYEYINLLVNDIAAMYASEKNIETIVDSEKMLFDVDTAIPLGLIVNELLTNAYKYAFKQKKRNTIKIYITKQPDSYKLVVSDNGEGLSDDFDIEKAKSLGLRLVYRLVRQLQGFIKIDSKNGANFEIIFKDAHQRKNIE